MSANRPTHIVQSPIWAEAKTKYGTPASHAGGVQYTKHKIPFTPYFYGYAPKVSPENINFAALKEHAEKENCIAINFDCPNITTDDPNAGTQEETLKDNCSKSPRQTFAKFNVLLDITPEMEMLLAKMHHKTRYNIRYAQKHGVTVREGNNEDLNTFISLQNLTAQRQKFFVHPNRYYQVIWDTLYPAEAAKMLVAEFEGKPISCWMFFVYEGVLYYPYGAWSGENQNLFPNNLLAFEAIKLGKNLGCHSFDMWGAAKDISDGSDPWQGFTKFKLGFGGKHVDYIDSYDLVINPHVYAAFNTANQIRWALLKFSKKL